MTLTSLPVFDTPCTYAGDFNCQHTDWGYNNISPDGECLAVWAANNDLNLLQDPKGNFTFYSGRWKTETNLDLDEYLGSFHRHNIDPPLQQPLTTTSKPVKRWNFRKANWKRYGTITKKLPLPDPRNANTAYQAFCSMTINAAKQCPSWQ